MVTVLAHGIGGRADLPIPLWMAQYGAAMALLVSFSALGAFWRTPRLEGARAGDGWPLPAWAERVADARATRSALRAVGVVLLAATLVTAAFGADTSASNPAPTWLYVWFWVGLVPASLLLGPIWRVMNPLRAISAGIARLSGDREERGARPLPPKLGYWPAALGLLAFTWLELVFNQPDRPVVVLVFVLAYTLVQVGLATVYGQRWYEWGDAFEVYSTLVGHLSPLARRGDGRLALRNPLVHLAELRPAPGLVAVVCVLLGSTAFDGLSRTRWWNDLILDASEGQLALLGTLGLLGSIAFVVATYQLASRGSRWLARASGSWRERLDWSFVHSLVPIAVGYTIAHYFSLFVFQGQAGYILASDPFGRGWDLFGTADWRLNYLAVTTRTIALVQVGAIVAGHVLGVVAAHDRAVALFDGRDKARGQYPLLVTMVVYTVGGIALLLGT